MARLMGLDLGTTSLKAVVYDSDLGQVICAAARPTPVQHPRAGWSEHDPEALWQTVTACIRECLQKAAGTGQPGRAQPPIAGLAISSMAEAGVLVDADGRAAGTIIAWYDRRSEPQAAWVEAQVGVEALYRITGQRASPSFGVTKLLWLKENAPAQAGSARMWLPVPAYVLHRLTGQAAVDYTIAARTLAFDQRTLGWSEELLQTFGLARSLFPPVFPGGTAVGTLTAQAAQETGLPGGTICALGGHDHLCATLAAGAHSAGAMTDSTGSANALLLLTPHFLPDPALAERGYASYAYVLKDLYALKGGLKAAGSAVEWLAKMLSPANGGPQYAELEKEAAEGAARRAGPLWLPHLIGSGTPQGDRYSRAALVGAQYEHNRGDLFRGMLESLALWTRHNVEEMQSLTGIPIDTVTLTGGVTRLRLLSQLKADALNRAVIVAQIPEAAATGAALLAGLGTGTFSGAAAAIGSLHYTGERIEPDPDRARWYETLYTQVYRPLYGALREVNTAMRRMETGIIIQSEEQEDVDIGAGEGTAGS